MRLALALTLALLAGCQSAPKVETVTVTVTELVGMPKELTRDCGNEKPRSQTWGEGKRLANARDAYLDECTARMRQIRQLSEEAEKANAQPKAPVR